MSWFHNGATVARPIGLPIGFEEKAEAWQRWNNHIERVVGRSAKARRIT